MSYLLNTGVSNSSSQQCTMQLRSKRVIKPLPPPKTRGRPKQKPQLDTEALAPFKVPTAQSCSTTFTKHKGRQAGDRNVGTKLHSSHQESPTWSSDTKMKGFGLPIKSVNRFSTGCSNYRMNGISPTLLRKSPISRAVIDKGFKMPRTKLYHPDVRVQVFQDTYHLSPMQSPWPKPKKSNNLHRCVDKENTPPAGTSHNEGLISKPLLASTPSVNLYKSKLSLRSIDPWNTKGKKELSLSVSDWDETTSSSEPGSGKKVNRTYTLEDGQPTLPKKVLPGTLSSRKISMDDLAGKMCQIKDEYYDNPFNRAPEVLSVTSTDSSGFDNSTEQEFSSNITLNAKKLAKSEMGNLMSAKRQVTFEEPVTSDVQPLTYQEVSCQPQVFSSRPSDHLAKPTYYKQASFHTSCNRNLHGSKQSIQVRSKTAGYSGLGASVNGCMGFTTKLCTHTTTTQAFILPIACSVISQMHSAPRPACKQCALPPVNMLEALRVARQNSWSDEETNAEVAKITAGMNKAIAYRDMDNPVASTLEIRDQPYTFEPIHVPQRTEIQHKGSAFNRILIC